MRSSEVPASGQVAWLGKGRARGLYCVPCQSAIRVHSGSGIRCIFVLNSKGSLTPSCTAVKAGGREALVPVCRGNTNAGFFLSQRFSFSRYHCATRKLSDDEGFHARQGCRERRRHCSKVECRANLALELPELSEHGWAGMLQLEGAHYAQPGSG